jgi:hypothetical protein
MTSRRGLAPAAALAALALFFVREAAFQGRAFYARDINMQWYGQMESFVSAVAAGSWPVWDPYVSFGQPLLANANNQLLYPPTWLNLLVRPWTYYTWFVAGHLLLAGLGAYGLGRRLQLSREGALVAGLVWVASGPVVSLGSLWNHLAATAWMPWCLLAADVALSTGRWTHALAWGAAVAAQVVTGSPDVTLMTAALMAALAAVRLRRPPPGVTRGRLAAAGAGAAAFAVALSAAQVLPSLDLAARAQRWGLHVEERTYWSLHPLSLLQVLLPVGWNDLPLRAEYRAALFESREPLLLSAYVGLPVAALALAALAGAPRPLRAALAAAGLVALVFALGRHTPFYGAVVALVPPLGIMRFPSKAMILVAFAAAMLAGMGFDAWRDAEGPRRRIAAVVCAGLAVAAAACLALVLLRGRWAAALLIPPAEGGAVPAPVTRALAASAGAAALVAGLAWWSRRRADAAPAVAAAALAILPLAWVHRSLNATAPRELFTFRPDLLERVRQEDHSRLYVYDYLAARGRSERHLQRPAPYVPREAARLAPFPWAGALANRMYLVPPVGAAYRVNDSYSRDNLGIQPTEVAELMAMLSYAEGSPLHLRLLRLGAVSQVAALHERGFEDLVPAGQLPGPYAEPIRLYAVPDPLPRAYVVAGTRIDRGPDTLLDPDFDPAREVVLPSGTPRPPAAFRAGEARVVTLRPDRVLVEARMDMPGHLVLVDAYDPGWRVTVDGREAPLLRANHAFRAVAVPPGTHAVEMRYRPPRVSAGLLVSALAAAGGLAAAVAAHRRGPLRPR